MNSEVHELELSMREAQKMVDLGKSLDRLMKNRDFRKLIQEEYLEKEAVRLVHLKGDANMQGEREQRNIDRDITAISSFAQFLAMVQTKAEYAQEAVDACQEAIAEVEAGGDE